MKYAKHDCYGYEGVGEAIVRRQFKAGDPVPPHIEVDAADVAERDGPEPQGVIGARESTTVGYDAQPADELQAEADRRDLVVEGTGKDGNVLKSDLVAALEADDE